MAFVTARANEFLLVGRRGRLENLGSARQAFLLPGTVWVLVPASKQEATFEFTQETKDGIPLRFKGIIVYRITDPAAAAHEFDFTSGGGIAEISTLLTHVCLGELRDAVSHLTMAECIEGRKTTLSDVAARALERAVGTEAGWGITIEVAQLAQVFIVDADLRRQLEAEVRNEIKVRSDQSDVRAKEETRLAQLASEGRVAEQKLAVDRQALELERDRFRTEMAVAEDRVNAEVPVRLLRADREREALERELETRRLQNELEALDVEREMLRPRADQQLRLELLPVEQAPQIVEAASKVLNGTSLSVYGQDESLVGHVGPVLEMLSRSVERALAGTAARGGSAES
ncbi:MAG TPA: SPFH domain-containing protein [Candidatus Limnocylindrales bacterium]|nr:SPFH domain-containing protein [Candidatus Limnocylindrales bacterium]